MLLRWACVKSYQSSLPLYFPLELLGGDGRCFLYIQSVSNYPRTFQFFVYCSHQCSFYIFFGAKFRTKIRSVWVQWYIVYNVSSCTYIIFNNMRESKNLLLLVIKNHSLWRHTCRAPGTCRALSTWKYRIEWWFLWCYYWISLR